MNTTRRLTAVFLGTLLAIEPLAPSVAWAAKNVVGQIQQVDVVEEGTSVLVQIRGKNLREYYPLLNKDAKGVPRIFLTFHHARLEASVPKTREGIDPVSRVDVRQIADDPKPVAEVALTLKAETSYTVRNNSHGVTIALQKLAEAAVPEKKTEPEVPAPAPVPAPTPAAPGGAIIQSGDVLYLSVSPAEELSREVIVDENGRISIPLIGAIEASGHTAEELSRTITARLSQYVAGPKVDIFIKSSTSKQISVMGQVMAPGSYTYQPKMRLLDVISRAGGFQPGANKRQVRVLRGAGAERKTIILNVEPTLASGDVTKDFLLEPGDLVEVTRGANALTIFGQVEHGGIYDYAPDMRLLDLISLAHGFKDGAKVSKIRIFRGESSKRTIVTVRFSDVLSGDLRANVPLAPGDVVYVPQRALWTYSTIFNVLTPITGLMMGVATIFILVKYR